MNTYFSSTKVSNSGCCRFVLDTDNWVIINADTNFQHIFQYSYMELTQKNNYANYIYEEDYKPLIQSLKHQLSFESRTAAANHRVVTKSGEVYSVSFSGCVSYEDGVALMECIFFNFKLMRGNENQDIPVNDFLKKTLSVLKNMPVGFLVAGVVLDKDKKPCDIIIDYVNSAGAGLLGSSAEVITGKKCISDFDAYEETVLEHFYKTAYTGEPYDIIRKHKITGKYLHYFYYQIYSGCVGIVIVDADEEVSLRRKCGVLENYVRTVPDNLKTGIVQYLDDEYQTIVYANNAAYKMFGYDREEFKQKFNNRLSAILEKSDDVSKAKIQNLGLYEPSYSFEREIYTKKGGKRRFSENIMRIINADGLEILQAEFTDTEDITNNKNELRLFSRLAPYMIVKYHIKDKLYIIEANERFYQFFGVDKDKYDGNPMLRTHEDDMNIVSRALAKAADGQDVDFVYRTQVRGQEEKCLHVYGGCVGYKNNYPVYIMLFNDITALNQIKKEAAYERARFDIFLSASKDIVIEYIINSDTLRLYANVADGKDSRVSCLTYEKFSKTADNGRLIHSEDSARMLDILSGKETENMLVRAKNIYHSGDDLCTYIISGNMLNRNGKPDRFTGFMHRIMPGKAVLPSEENILKTAAMNFISRCERVVCIDMSNGYYRHIRMKNSALRTTDFGNYNVDVLAFAKKFVSRETLDEFIENMSMEGIRKNLENKRSHKFLFRSKNGSGGQYRSAEYFYTDEKRNTVLLEISDISDICRNGNPFFNMDKNITLNFLMRISRDVMAPLNMIISIITSARNPETAPETLAVYLDKINICTVSVSEFIANILELIKLESGKFMIENDVFAVKDLLNVINNRTAPHASSRNIRFTIDSNQSDKYYRGDIIKISHITSILLTNALRYTKSGEYIEFSLKESGKDEKTRSLIITVLNNGEGIPKEVVSNIFNVYEYTNDKHISTEISLTIVKLTAVAMGGNFTLSQKDGKTEFVLSLPVEVCIEEEYEKHENNFGRKNILIADDNIIYAESIISSERDNGVNFDIAVSADDAVGLYMNSVDGYYDYIFIDMSIESDRGADIIDRVREANRNDSRTVKIIAVIKDSEDISDISGADEILTKSQQMERINKAAEM